MNQSKNHKRIQKIFEMNKNENKYIKICRIKVKQCLEINSYIRKVKSFQINDLRIMNKDKSINQ